MRRILLLSTIAIVLASCSESASTSTAVSRPTVLPPSSTVSPSATAFGSATASLATEVRRPVRVERPIAVEAPVELEPAAGCPSGTTPDEPGPTDQARPPGRTGPMSFDRDSHRIVALIGLPRDEPALAQLWTFDVCNNTWSRMGAGIPLTNDDDRPGFVYDPGTDRVVLMGPRWVRTYDDALDAWTFGEAPTDPGGYGNEAFLDPATGRLVVLDDAGSLWSYDVAEDQWWRVEQFGKTPAPGGSADSVTVLSLQTYLPSADRLVTYLGYCDPSWPTGSTYGSVATTWQFDLRTRTWSEASTETPLVTDFSCGWGLPDIGEANAYDEASGRMVVFTPDEFFVYHADAHRWTSVPMDASSTPPLRPSDDVAYDPVNERVVVYGDGMWAFDLATRTWTQLLAPASRERSERAASTPEGER